MEFLFNGEELDPAKFIVLYETSSPEWASPRLQSVELASRSGKTFSQAVNMGTSKFSMTFYVSARREERDLVGREAVEKNLEELRAILSPYGRKLIISKTNADGLETEAEVVIESSIAPTLVGSPVVGAKITVPFTLVDGAWRDAVLQTGHSLAVLEGGALPTRDWQLTIKTGGKLEIKVRDLTSKKFLYFNATVTEFLTIDALSCRAWDKYADHTRALFVPPLGFDLLPGTASNWKLEIVKDGKPLKDPQLINVVGRRRF